MLSKLHIKNFQSHKDSELEFTEGMNVIIGKTDSGKSAIIRALKLITQNRPGGDDYRSNFTKEDTEVILETSDSFEIKRIKGNSNNLYTLNTYKEPFRAFGTEVPEEIKKALNFEDINFQFQMDSPFLFKETSGNIAAYFNKIAKLDKIDTGLQNVNKQIKAITQEIKFSKSELKAKRVQLENLPDLVYLESELTTLELKGVEKANKQNKIERISKIITNLEAIQQKINSKKLIVQYEKEINTILELCTKRTKFQSTYQTLRKTSIKFYNLSRDIKKKENLIQSEIEVNNILELYRKQAKTKTEFNSMNKLVNSIVNSKTIRENKENSLKNIETEFHTNFPDICPLCQTKVK